MAGQNAFMAGAVLFRMIVVVGEGSGARCPTSVEQPSLGLVIGRKIVRMSGGSHKKGGPYPS